MGRPSRPRLRVVAAAVLAVFLAMQLLPFGREHTNPPVTASAPWTSERASQIAQQSCAACHTNTTRWPWYSHVAPASWLVAIDVEERRDELNFSTWDRDRGEADDAVEAIQDGSMPPLRYTLMHPGARLSDEEQQLLIEALRVMDD